MCKLTFIIYDGIQNSVFFSQVLQPLLNLLHKDNKLEITLVSFEKGNPSKNTLSNLIQAHSRLHFVLCHKLVFFGKLSLYPAIYQLKKLLKRTPSNKIIARGPLAGWITIKAMEKNICTQALKSEIIIQARGLCAQEYRFAYQDLKENFIKKHLRKLIYKKLHQIEKEAYSNKNSNVTFESVSPALKDYLITNFNTNSSKILISKNDIPPKINAKNKIFFRNQIREKLKIPKDAIIYCYSGSAKPWQCVPEAIEYFSKKIQQNKKSFLLILSQDQEQIEKIVHKNKINKNNFLLINSKPENLHQYLAACDAGLLFRNKDIINWVSRPTKMLEYQSAGIEIIHNNTVAWLENNTKNQI